MEIQVKGISKSFDETEVLHNISFKFTSGKAFGLLGRNGAGKTTTIRILMDVFKPNKGEIMIDDKPFNPKDYLIGYMPEERGMYPKLKVLEQLVYFGELRGISSKEAKASALSLLDELEMSEYKNRKLQTLSKGNQQKIQLAQTLLGDPDIIILDEPFSGLDPVNSQILKDIISERIKRGKCVIFSSHQMSYVEEFCDDIIILKEGNVTVSGNLETLKKDIGKGKVVLKINDKSIEETKAIVENELSNVLTYEESKKEYVIASVNQSKKEVIKELDRLDYDVNIYGDYMPSLNDIFVKEVGDEQ